jgi:hypothetical protein
MVMDPESVSGDSGGPLYSFEKNQACVFAVHSTIDFGNPASPELVSYNPLALHALQLMNENND